jgi:predicted PurR-regulated permease PerM
MGTLLGIVGLLLAVPAAVVVATLVEELSPREIASEGEQRPKEDPSTAQAPDTL